MSHTFGISKMSMSVHDVTKTLSPIPYIAKLTIFYDKQKSIFPSGNPRGKANTTDCSQYPQPTSDMPPYRHKYTLYVKIRN